MAVILVAGNCQAAVVAGAMRQALPGTPVYSLDYGEILGRGADLVTDDGPVTHVFAAQGGTLDYFEARIAAETLSIRLFACPAIFFTGYHPDTVYPDPGRPRLLSPTGTNHSALVLLGWRSGLTVEETVGLFCPETYDRLGYPDHFAASRRVLLQSAEACGFSLEADFERWRTSGQVPFHTPNHPRPEVLAVVAEKLLAQAGFAVRPGTVDASRLVDPFEHLVGWPVYPGLAELLGVPASYSFRLPRPADGRMPGRSLDLADYVAESYALYAVADPEALKFERLEDPRYAELLPRPAPSSRDEAGGANPYRGLPDSQFWSRSVARPAPGEVDPATSTTFVLSPDTRIATAGSCFAQHIARALKRRGYTYLVTDGVKPAGVRPDLYAQSDVFSARYGNIYSSRQLLQLIQRAYGDLKPDADIWRSPSGAWLDAFRPQIVEGGFLSREELLADRERHLGAVRSLFETLDVMVFTLGLTEVWRSKCEGLVVPVAPGVVSTAETQQDYAFHNLDVDEVRADLAAFIAALRRVNPRARVILTVSPVPLIASYSDRHVLTATTYSKAVLRVAAEHCALSQPDVSYFPSYEIITGAFNRGAYYEDDLRSVTPDGVDHVMRVFFHRFAGLAGEREITTRARLDHELATGQGLLCEEILNEE